ncbi:hypothetical protein, partial [Streptomyces odonnellii]|uniref:hypothetical protein n=1 Tax=Streptomyces odonnellii TaxID=1417980 RepID=UPI0006268C9D
MRPTPYRPASSRPVPYPPTSHRPVPYTRRKAALLTAAMALTGLATLPPVAYAAEPPVAPGP